MTGPHHVEWAELVDYLAGELDAHREEAVETHLMACSACTSEADHVASITSGIRSFLPPLATERTLDSLRRRGLRVQESPRLPGSDGEAVLGAHLDVLAFRLLGVNPAAVSASFSLRVVETGHVLIKSDQVPIDQSTGSVLLLCSPHYAGLPPNVVASVVTRDQAGAEAVSEYTLRHVWTD